MNTICNECGAAGNMPAGSRHLTSSPCTGTFVAVDEAELTTTESLRELIGEAVYQAGQEHEFPELQADVRTFAEAGVMTRDEGLVIRLGDREFQVTIVQSR